MRANSRHSAVILLIVLSALAMLLDLFPDIQSSSLIVAVGILSGAIEIIGFLRDRSSGEGRPQTNIAGDVQGPVLCDQIKGPVAAGAGGEAADFRGSTGTIYKPSGPVNQHIGDGNVIGDGSRSTVIKKPATQDVEPPELSDKKEAEGDIERLNLRMDVAVPDNVQVDKVFDVAVSIRRKSSPILSIDDLAHVGSGPALAKRHKSQSFIRLQVQISAPDCVIHDNVRQSVLYIIGEDSDPIYFQLTPKKQGAISIVVRLYQEDERLGNARVHTFASNEAIGQVEVITSSMPVRRNPRVDFLLVAPLPEERDAVLKKLEGYKKLPPIEEDIHTYYQSEVATTLSDDKTGIYRVTVLPLIGMGQVQAAMATTTAIDRWGPRYVIVIGIAGGIAEKGVRIGDILIADQIANYELQKITPEDPEIRWDVHQVDQRLLNACKNFTDDSWKKLVQVDRPEQGEPRRFYGPIASGDKVVAFGDFLEKHQETWPKLIGVEMEAAGAAKAAFQSSTNSGFFMVRCVSDLADENKEKGEVKRWRLYACDVAASFAIALLKSGPVPVRSQKQWRGKLIIVEGPDRSDPGGRTIIESDGNVLGDHSHSTVVKDSYIIEGDYIINEATKVRLPFQRPPRVPHFTGREAELAALLQDLQPGRAVTVCGPGGMGKTALSAEAIWKLAPGSNPPQRFPDGIIFHTFYHRPQAALALEAFARAYGEDPRQSPLDAAKKALAGRIPLIVLDGAEACDDLQTVLSVTGSCGVLITTRRHSDAPEDFSDLPPLPEDKAIELLRAWGKEMASDEGICRSICSLLGRLPLAIFLAGRYLSHQSQLAGDYLAWLKETPLEALDLGKRQHQSIPLLMEHSLKQVSDQACACLGLAGILALKPFPAEVIAEALQISSAQANISLGELVNYGLLIRPDLSYQTTHALAHTYARESLAVPKDALARLAGHYDRLSREQVALGLEGYARLDAERDHILAVQSACNKAGLWGEARSLTWALRDYLHLQGNWQEVVALVQVGLEAACSDGERYDEASFLNHLGLAYAALGEPHKAIEFYEQALAIAREIGDRRSEGAALGNLGLAYADLGEPRKAIEFHEQALVIAREIGDRRGEGNRLGNLGLAYVALGEPRKAIEFYEQALAIAREIGDRRNEGNWLGNLGLAYADLGEPCKAIEFYEQALAIAREIGDRRNEGNWLGNLGNAYAALGEPRKAVEHYEQHLAITREIGDRRGEAITSWNLGLEYEKTGDLQRSAERIQVCVDFQREIGHPDAEKDADYLERLREKLRN